MMCRVYVIKELFIIGLFITGFLGIFSGCDKERKSQCEWYLVPDESRIKDVKDGLIPVCARNYTSNKQDCRLQTTLDFAKSAYLKTFRYTDLKVKTYGNPRTITEIKTCVPDK